MVRYFTESTELWGQGVWRQNIANIYRILTVNSF